MIEEERVVTYEDAERVRLGMKMRIKDFIKFIGVSRSTYNLWKRRGMSGTAQRLVRLLMAK